MIIPLGGRIRSLNGNGRNGNLILRLGFGTRYQWWQYHIILTVFEPSILDMRLGNKGMSRPRMSLY